MADWRPNIWQRILFGIGAVILLLAAVNHLGGLSTADEGLVPFLWAVLFAAVAVSPRFPKEPVE